MATRELWSNNGTSTLLGAFNIGATSCSVQAGHGARFRSPAAGEIFRLTLRDSAGNIEICYCTQRTTDTFNVVVRGQEGTTERNWLSGDLIEGRFTRASYEGLAQKDAVETITANWIFNGNNSFTGTNTHAGIEAFNTPITFGSSAEVVTANSLQMNSNTGLYHMAAGNQFIFKGPGTGAAYDRLKITEANGIVGCDASGVDAAGGPKGPGKSNWHGVFSNGVEIPAQVVGGMGQTPYDKSGSRSLSTVYQNLTGYPIEVVVDVIVASGGGGGVVVDYRLGPTAGTMFRVGYGATASDDQDRPCSFIVPKDWYYEALGGNTIRSWVEFRHSA